MRINLPRPVRERLGRDLSAYLKEELEADVSPLEAVLLLDYLAERLGPEIYNQALADAQSHLRSRIEALSDALTELEQPAAR